MSSVASESAQAAAAAPRIGRFEVERELSRGGQGTVYRARDPDLDRPVAIKRLHAGGVGLADGADGFAEGRALARLRHPNIVSVFEAGMVGDAPYLVLEFIEGCTLRHWLADKGAPGLERALELWAQIVAGVAHAHAEGILHLDLSPANVMIDATGAARVMDFGLASSEPEELLSRTEVAGTPRYMAPEQVRGQTLSAATDVHALGLIGFELITGRPVVTATGIARIVEAVTRQAPPVELVEQAGAEPAIRALIAAALDKDPARRPADAAELERRLQACLAERAEAAGRPELRHSTVGFLLRRMERRGDFPALAGNLARINGLTAEGSSASAAQIATAVLQDYAITNKLLKVANSALYRAGAGEITRVSDAITRLGLERVRMICTSLLFIEHLRPGDDTDGALHDALVCSFLAGILARHLCTRIPDVDREEGFICGMFRNVGRLLAMYYFPDDYADLHAMRAELGLGESEAYRRVFGVDELAVGAAVARVWKFPERYVQAMRPIDGDRAPKPASPPDWLWLGAGFANELCDVAVNAPHAADPDAAVRRFRARFGAYYRGDEVALYRLLAAALAKCEELGPGMGLRPQASPVLASVRAWCVGRLAEAEAEAEDAGGEDAAGRPPASAPASAPAPAVGGKARRWRLPFLRR